MTNSLNISFLKNNFDCLYSICQKLYEKYLLKMLNQMNHLDFRKFHQNIHLMLDQELQKLGIEKIRNILIKGLKVLVRMMSFDFFHVDLLWMSKACLSLCKLFEMKGEFFESIKFLENTIWVFI